MLTTYEEVKSDIQTKKSTDQAHQQVIDITNTLLLDIVKKRPDVEMLFCYTRTEYDQKQVFKEDEMRQDEKESKVLRKLYHDPELQKKERFNHCIEDTVAPWVKNSILWEKYSKKFSHENKCATQNLSVPQQVATQTKLETTRIDIKLSQPIDSATKDMGMRNKSQERQRIAQVYN